jgi:hypothetical protein
MKLNQFAQMRGFQFAYQRGNPQLVEHALNSDQGDEIRAELKLKRLQFDCVSELYAEVESVCALLECSKREFLEMAVREAIDQAQSTFMDSFKEVDGRDFMDVYGVEE